MAETITCLEFFIFLDLILLFSSFGCISSGSDGLGSLKLIHRHSPVSPLYQTNISDFERFIMDVRISIDRNINITEEPEFPVTNHLPYITVELGVGTPTVQKTFAFDTYSSLTWIQCKPCPKCFKQDEPLFDTKTSRSYKKANTLLSSKWRGLNSNFKCSFSKCSYRYPGGYFVKGIASEEQFTMQTSIDKRVAPYRMPGLAFLCGTETNIDYIPSTINGVMGFNLAHTSFAGQLHKQIRSKFSYCVTPLYGNTTKLTYLKFGDDAVMQKFKIQSSIGSANLLWSASPSYAVEVINFSINNVRIINPGGVVHGGIGNLTFDSNTPYTSLHGSIFLLVKSRVENHFAKFGVSRITRHMLPYNMGPLLRCYSHPSGFDKFPHMTIHFATSELHIPSENLFVHVAENMSCLAMVTGDTMILGLYQQQNIRFIFDLDNKRFSFAKEDC